MITNPSETFTSTQSASIAPVYPVAKQNTVWFVYYFSAASSKAQLWGDEYRQQYESPEIIIIIKLSFYLFQSFNHRHLGVQLLA